MKDKSIVAATGVLAMALTLSACAGTEPEAGQSSTDTVASTPTWTPPVDGVWPASARHSSMGGYGDEFIFSSMASGPMYSGRIVDVPRFTVTESGVTMEQEVEFTRLGEHAEPSEYIDVRFMAGLEETSEGFTSENVDGSLQCDGPAEKAGDVVTCTISAQPAARHVQNSYWMLKFTYVAAWPGQETRD